MATKIVKNRVPDLMRAMKDMAKREVLVGIPSESSDNARKDGTITNAEIGMINEFGAPEANIPARPHLIPGVQEAWPAAQRRMAKGAEQILKLRPNASGIAESALEGAGILARDAVVQKINDVLTPELAPSTLADRRSKGFEGESPLIVTGAYKQSITYVVDDAESSRSL
jgi:hypothetical protein